jgi:hypothetical protein
VGLAFGAIQAAAGLIVFEVIELRPFSALQVLFADRARS